MRSSGILMPITSLPSPYGIGTMGSAARDFVDFLAAAGQTFWQVLPICPTSFGDSPYQTFSTFAGNPYLIDLDDLSIEGLLDKETYTDLNWGADPLKVDYNLIYQQRYSVLQRAYERFLTTPQEGFSDFCNRNSFWLEDYALFMALKSAQKGVSWQKWDNAIRNRNDEILAQVRCDMKDDITFWKSLQFLFFRQWRLLKEYANNKGVRIIGDLPFYVSGDSSDVWAHPEQFQLDENLYPTEVAGCPPDGFSEKGQLWGNPIFNWAYMEQNGYEWWVKRIAYQCEIYDVVRIDHFRGFDSFYAIPYGAPDARNGRWCEGPGIKLFERVNNIVEPHRIIAEDLGFLTPSVHALRDETGYPGMRVLEFGFDGRDEGGSIYLPHNFPVNCVAYIGTHDNDTALGWLNSAPLEGVDRAKHYLRLNEAEGYNWGMMRSLWASRADLTIVQMQDILGLGSEARINIPSTVGTNWRWRADRRIYSRALADRLRLEMDIYCRIPDEN